MHKRDDNETVASGRTAPDPERNVSPDDPAALAARLKKSQLELETLKDALAVIEQETSIAREKIDTLSEIESFLMQENSFLTKKNSLLRSELAQLAKRGTSSQQAYQDELTGLPSRRVLLDRLKQAIALATRQHKRVALLFLHIDEFNQIKDKLGQENSDKLLQALAERLNGCLRTADTVSHVGDDEFIVMLPEVDGPQSAAAVEQKVRNQLAKPYAIGGNTVPVAITIGRAMYPVERQPLREVKEGGNVSVMPRKHDRK